MRSGAMVMTTAIDTGALAQNVGIIEATGPKGPLRGTTVLPASDAPMILIIPGSGPTNRDGNSPPNWRFHMERKKNSGEFKIESLYLRKEGGLSIVKAARDIDVNYSVCGVG